MFSTTLLVQVPRGWLLSLPVPPFVEVAMASGVVKDEPSPTTGGGVDGREDDVGAAAVTTVNPDTITTFIQIIPTTPAPPSSHPRDADGAPLVHANGAPALLPMPMIVTANCSSTGGRGHPSGGPRRARQFVDHSPPPPTVVVDRAAWRSGGRPTAYANTSLVAAPPRPGPASLLSSSKWPQPGHISQRGGRAGTALRATSKKGQGVASVVDGIPSADALVVPHAGVQAG